MPYELSTRYATCKRNDEFLARVEHSYYKLDWNCGELHLPTTYLFSEKKCRHFSGRYTFREETSDYVDVDTIESGSECAVDDKSNGYSLERAKHSMEECERYAQLVEISGDSDDMESPYSENTLSHVEKKLYRKIVEILKSNQLARLAYKQIPNEAILRRIASNRSARLTKRLLSKINWDPSTTSKLHMKLMTSLPRSLVPRYLDILQTLMAEVPTLVEPMLRAHMLRLNISANEAMDLLLSTPWCPVSEHINRQALTLHPSVRRPTFLFIRDAPPSGETASWKRRLRFMSRQLSSIGRLIKILDWQRIRRFARDPEELVELCLKKVSKKIAELKGNNDDPGCMVLIGRTFTSLLACEVSSMEKVDAVVCLGFPMSNRRGDPCCAATFDVPTLFFVGEEEEKAEGGGRYPVEKLEKFRSKFQAVTGLVVVRGADEELRVSQSKQMTEEILQPMADRCMLEKLAEFLGIVLDRNGCRHSIPQQPPDGN